MAVFYLDTSALVKYYVTEPGSAWIRRLIDDQDDVLVSAELCQQHPLRGFDAIHLASGLYLQETLAQQDESVIVTYVAGDDSLITAAQAEGLKVDNPFWHTDLDVHLSL